VRGQQSTRGGHGGPPLQCVILLRVKAIVRFVAEDLFLGTTPSGHAIALDTDKERSSAPSPVELLLIALGSCTATDVAGILAKKRQTVTSYIVEVSGVRRDEHPRSFTSMKVHHILTGKSLSPKAVAAAIELSETKYCSVAATLRPAVDIQTTFEIIEEPATQLRE
jgi:putative redox protein